MDVTTIAAISTPSGRGGIGIIKISGNNALNIAALIFRKSKSTPDPSGNGFESHRLYHGHIVDRASGAVLDEVLLSVMKAPHSYTREDVVEINAHSGPVILSAIMDLVIANGARFAAPGEFTKRAFLNGRIDLTQAEGIIDLINAQTEQGLRIASAQLSGELGSAVRMARETVLGVLGDIEAEIDFPDDVKDAVSRTEAYRTIQTHVVKPIAAMLERYRTAHVFRDGIRLAIVGKPNVGKSSLLNRMIQKDRVIVTSIPGTTRDLIEESLDICGIPVVIVDTAGLHPSEDPVEVIGIRKTEACIEASELVLFLVDAGGPLTQADKEIYRKVCKKKSILIVNKMDLLPTGRLFPVPERWNLPTVHISALYDRGIDRLKQMIASLYVGAGAEPAENRMVPNLRHKYSLELSLESARSVLEGLENNRPVELIAIDAREAVDRLGEILGLGVVDTILDQIFSRFCIGK